MREITELLNALGNGDEEARQELWERLYGELGSRASRRLGKERGDHTLETGALVHEAFLRLEGAGNTGEIWKSREQFLALASQVMRRILVDHARRHRSLKRGGEAPKLQLEEGLVYGRERANELLALDEALNALAAAEPEQARIVELRFFGGLSAEEIARCLGISVPTVTRRWRLARARLYRQLAEGI